MVTQVIGAGGAWQKIAEIEVTADTTAITFTGLDLDADKAYFLLFKVKNPSTSELAYYLFFNDDTTTSNYYNQLIHGDDSNISGARENRPVIVGITGGSVGLSKVTIMRSPDGRPRYMAENTRESPSSIRVSLRYGAWTTDANVTKIEIQSQDANAIGAGSKVILFKLSS